ncbi:MAG: methyl-accepting chemotaxis sensory transducer [Caulobacter sp.]|nr:methyl-accepting chemotaxis sensory transducer [Caulobacter sp.]
MRIFSLDDAPLAVKIGLAPILALIAMALIAGGSLWINQTQTAALQNVVHKDVPASLRLADISQQITAEHGELYRLLTHQGADIDKDKIGGEADALTAQIKATRAEVDKAIGDADPANKPALQGLKKELSGYSDAVDLVMSMLQADFNAAASFTPPFEEQYVHMNKTLAKAVEQTRQTSIGRAEASAAQAATLATLAAIMAGVALLVVGAIAALLTIRTRQGVIRIANATEKLAAGDNNVDLDKLKRSDELGAIVRSLQVFRENQLRLADLHEREQEASAERANARAEQEKTRAVSEAEQTQVVQGLASGLDHLCNGNLTFRLETPFAPAYEKLRTDFNTTVTQLQEIIRSIAGGAMGIESTSGEISSAADDLSRRTEQQAASLEQTAAALDQITAAATRTAEGASHADKTVAAAGDDARSSGEVVRKAVQAMSEIENSSRQIHNIIGLIDEIAFQTNLLALNAGVEAARAGDAGRGFAVVASEVRALAQRSADAAKEIKGLIATSSSQVKSGSELVGETGKALERIVVRVAEINQQISEIAQSVSEQSTGLKEVNIAVNRMDQMTQQNAAMVEQSTAASHSMKREAVSLGELMRRFNVGGAVQARNVGGHAPAPSPRPAAPAPPARPAAKPAYSYNGNAARKAEPAADGWEEF